MKLILLPLSLVILMGCRYDPHAHLYTTEEPKVSDVIGTYKLSSETLNKSDLSELEGKECMLELFADGTFKGTNIPPFSNENPGVAYFSSLVTVTGAWQITTTGSVDNGFSLKKVYGIAFKSGSIELAQPTFSGKKSPYGLIYTLSDPDAGEALLFERTK